MNPIEFNRRQQENITKGFVDNGTDERLQKAVGGEGSRGGHVVGHTKSGNPIYEQMEAHLRTNNGLRWLHHVNEVHTTGKQLAGVPEKSENGDEDEAITKLRETHAAAKANEEKYRQKIHEKFGKGDDVKQFIQKYHDLTAKQK